MSEQELTDLQENENGMDSQTGAISSTKRRTLRVIVFAVMLLILFLIIGAALGYQQGVQARLVNYESKSALAAAAQFQLGLIDLEAGRYDTAIKRFEYVISLDPNFPEAAQKLQEAMLGAATSSQPTTSSMLPVATDTPQMTATPDLRGQEELFDSAKMLIKGKLWKEAIATLDQLRLVAPEFNTAKVDGMYYIAYRNLGVDKILSEGNLEGGMYDLSIAERFGLLDVEANTYRNYSRYYTTGSSFWGVDWQQAIFYFSQVSMALPNLRDGTGLTSTDRYRQALIGYGDLLYSQDEYCSAQEQYELANAMNPVEEGFAEKLELARENCGEHGNQSESPDDSQPTSGETTPTETATEEPTGEPTTDPNGGEPTVEPTAGSGG